MGQTIEKEFEKRHEIRGRFAAIGHFSNKNEYKSLLKLIVVDILEILDANQFPVFEEHTDSIVC